MSALTENRPVEREARKSYDLGAAIYIIEHLLDDPPVTQPIIRDIAREWLKEVQG